jgi:hypothetical protein
VPQERRFIAELHAMNLLALLPGIENDFHHIADSVSLLPRGIASLAKFTFKCAIIANHMSLGGEPFFTPFARHRFRETLEIPDGVQMWFGAFQGMSRYSGKFDARYIKSSSDATHDLDFYVFTFAAGRLTSQVVATRWTKLHRRGQELPAVHFDAFWDQAATEFWPSHHGLPILWPPPKYFGDDTIQEFTNRLSGSVTVSFPRAFHHKRVGYASQTS